MWDGLAAHRGKLLRAWRGRQRSWLVVSRWPVPPRAQPGRTAVDCPYCENHVTEPATFVGLAHAGNL